MTAGLLVPEQLALLARLVVEMFEEVRIGFVGDAAIGLMRRAHCLGWEGLPGRATWGRIASGYYRDYRISARIPR